MIRGIRAVSPHQQKTGGALDSETPCETKETAPPREQNRNILSFGESFRKVEVLCTVRLGSLIRRVIGETIWLVLVPSVHR